jgi:peptidoglycan-associated lipoprotein
MKCCTIRPAFAVGMAAMLTLGACTTTKEYDWVQASPPVRPQPVRVEPVVVEPVTPPAAPSLVTPALDLTQDFAAAAGDRVYFDTNQSMLRPEARATLERQAAWLARHPEVRARIEGNADYRGDESYNRALSERRAETVRAYLIGQGVAAYRLSVNSLGEARPVEYGVSEDVLARNRNVQTVVIDDEKRRAGQAPPYARHSRLRGNDGNQGVVMRQRNSCPDRITTGNGDAVPGVDNHRQPFNRRYFVLR